MNTDIFTEEKKENDIYGKYRSNMEFVMNDMEKRLEPDEFLDIVKSECILESLIDQGQELAAFHANSVNTVRMVTCMNKKGEFYYLFALLRVGQGGSIVDNVGSGGLVSMIDLETGNVCSDAFCRTKYYELHPDTKVRFKGTKIPEWDKLLEIAKQLHTSQPRIDARQPEEARTYDNES